MGEMIVVKETMKRGVNIAVSVFFLNWQKSRPKPMIVNTAART